MGHEASFSHAQESSTFRDASPPIFHANGHGRVADLRDLCDRFDRLLAVSYFTLDIDTWREMPLLFVNDC